MPIKYCPSAGCGARFESSYEQPAKFCPKCGKSLSATFIPIPTSTVAPEHSVATPVIPGRSQRVFRDARGNDISHLYQRAEVPQPQRRQGDDEYVDLDEKYALAQELAASISATDFGFSIAEDAKDKSVKLGSILGPVLAAQSSKGKTKAKRSRKS